MLLLGLLAAMMLVASPVLAHQGGPTHGNKYSKNYYPNGYFKYCEPDGSKYYGKTKASKWCDKYYKEYTKKTFNGKKWYYVHVYYQWKTPDGKTHKSDPWYYCASHKCVIFCCCINGAVGMLTSENAQKAKFVEFLFHALR